MSKDCDQELCPNWGGGGCICDVLDLARDPICERSGEVVSRCWHCEEGRDQ